MEDALSMNTLRIALVGLTAIAAVVAAVFAMWVVAGVLTAGVIAHGLMWAYLRRRRREELGRLHDGVQTLLRQES